VISNLSVIKSMLGIFRLFCVFGCPVCPNSS
jgi:hypothetical protein